MDARQIRQFNREYNSPRSERNQEIYRLRKEEHRSMQEIADTYGISKQRVDQIVQRVEEVKEAEKKQDSQENS